MYLEITKSCCNLGSHLETFVFSLLHALCLHVCVFLHPSVVCVCSHTRGCACLCAAAGRRRGYILQQLNCMRLLRPPPFVYCRLLFQGPPALDKLQTFDGLVAEHSNNMLRSSANYSTIKCGCTGKECEHVYCVDKPKRFAAVGRKNGKESLKMIKEVGQSNLLSS